MDASNPLWPVLAVLAAYMVGSLSFAVIVSRLMGLNGVWSLLPLLGLWWLLWPMEKTPADSA